MARFRKSLGGLIYLSEKLDNQHDHLRKDFEISRVYQVGPTWYVKILPKYGRILQGGT